MNHAKLFSILVAFVALCYGAVGFYFLPRANFQSDLTRMAMLPETQFGWRKPQPVIDKQLFMQSSMMDADVLVIGDSFSAGLEWQTVLTSHGMKVHTEHWGNIRAVCSDFDHWLKIQGFHGRYVIFQIVERNLIYGLQSSADCTRMQSQFSHSRDGLREPPIFSFDPDHNSWSGRLSVGIQAEMNYRKYAAISIASNFKSAILPNEVKVARVENGCELFSHSNCKDALFLSYDSAEEVPPKAVELVEAINDRIRSTIPIWVFVPNKSTTYLYPDKGFWKDASHRWNSPDLLQTNRNALAAKTIDLYPANNTHYSTTGYLLMGEEIYRSMSETTDNPPKR